MGNRTSRELVRSGAAKACIWATFEHIPAAVKAKLEQCGYEAADDLLLYREISAEGKGSCRINGMPATAGVVRDISAGLLSIHGQHDSQGLTNPALHLGLLDQYAQNEAQFAAYYQRYRALVTAKRQLDALLASEADKQRRIDALTAEIDAIDAAALQPGEEKALTERQNIITHAQKHPAGADGGAPGAGRGRGRRTGRRGGSASAARWTGCTTRPARTRRWPRWPSGCRNCTMPGGNWRPIWPTAWAPMILTPGNWTRSRAGWIPSTASNRSSAWRSTSCWPGAPKRPRSWKLPISGQKIEELRGEQQLYAKAKEAAEELTQSRLTAFTAMNRQMKAALAFLNMPGIRFALRHCRGPLVLPRAGHRRILISANPGEEPKPLAKIASGGELSRIMLALKSALADRDALPTVIYDEIDTGVSGLAAGRIGQLLHQTAQGRQVLCITHTPRWRPLPTTSC